MVLGRELALPCQWRSGEAKQTWSDGRTGQSLGMSLSLPGGERGEREVRLKLGLHWAEFSSDKVQERLTGGRRTHMGRARTPFAYLVVPGAVGPFSLAQSPLSYARPAGGHPSCRPKPQSKSHVAYTNLSRTMLFSAVIPISNCRSQKT